MNSASEARSKLEFIISVIVINMIWKLSLLYLLAIIETVDTIEVDDSPPPIFSFIKVERFNQEGDMKTDKTELDCS